MPGTRNRESSNDGPSDGTAGPALLSQARRAAGSLVDNVQQRLPADMAKQVREGQRTVERNLKRLQQQMRRSATQADVDRLSQRIDELSRDVEALIAESRGRASSSRTGSGASSPARTGRSSTARTPRRSPSEGGTKRSGGGPQSSEGGAEESGGGPEAG